VTARSYYNHQYGSADGAERWLSLDDNTQYGSADAAERWLSPDDNTAGAHRTSGASE
jgi:hypothetical protein